MTSTLPLELQLHILELALPPLIRRNLDERVRLCKAFSLVHRSWTRTAQRELHEHVSLAYKYPARLDSAAQKRIDAAQEGGWRLKRLDVDLETFGGHTAWLNPGQAVADWVEVEEMWLALGKGDSTALGAASLHRLHMYDDWTRGLPSFLIALPTQLTYLALHGVYLGRDGGNWFTSSLSALKSLILDDVYDVSSWQALVPSPVKLRSLACRGNFPRIKTDTLANMPHLRHFIAIFNGTCDAADLWPALFEPTDSHTSPVRLPPHLHTFTCLATKHDLVPDDRSAWTSLTSACDELGTVLDIRLGLTTREVDDFDLEEWAYSVGA